MISYFEANYIKGKYKPIIWNVSELETRTNNAVKSFNSMFNRMVRISHPPINEFIRQLYVVIDDIHLKATKAVNENQLPRVKKDTREKNKTVKNTIERGEHLNIKQFIFNLVDVCSINDGKFELLSKKEQDELEKELGIVDGIQNNDDESDENDEISVNDNETKEQENESDGDNKVGDMDEENDDIFENQKWNDMIAMSGNENE